MAAANYKVMARRWRPEVFQDVVSQTHITQTLQNAIRSDRVAHAYLFSGQRGTGKTTTARLLAKALNCEKGPTPDPCGTCASCVDIQVGRSLDVREIDGASTGLVDDIRQLREEVGYAASKGKRKVYIIDEVHMLSTGAFNALLKTLEEPPPHVVFVFATTDPQKVPETILSRCQRYNFRRIPDADIAGRLREMVTRDKIEADDEALALIAHKAEGALRDAQSLLEQVWSFAADSVVTADVVRDLLGIIPLDLFFETTEAVERGDGKAALAVIDRMLVEGGDIGEFTQGLIEHLRHLLVACVGDGQGIPENDRPRYLDLAARFEEGDLVRMLQVVSGLELDLSRVAEPRFWLEITVMRLVQMSRTVDLQEVVDRLDGVLSSGVLPAAVPAANPRSPAPAGARRPAARAGTSRQVPRTDARGPSAPASAQQGGRRSARSTSDDQPPPRQKDDPGPAGQAGLPTMQPPAESPAEQVGEGGTGDEAGAEGLDLSLEAVVANWEAIVEEVKGLRISVGTFLGEGKPAELSGRRLKIVFPKRRELHALQVNRNAEVVQEAIEKLLGHSLRVTAAVDYDTDDQPPKPDVPPEDHALVQTALRLFDGEILNPDR